MIKQFASLLRRIVGRIKDMPSPKPKTWKNIRISLTPSGQDIIRSLIHWIPYFWDNEITFDLAAKPSEKKGFNPLYKCKDIKKTWQYEWELCSSDNALKTKGNDIFHLDSKKMQSGWIRKFDAIKLENVEIGRYKIFITLTDSNGEKSDRLFISAFTVKDKEEYLSTYILPAIVALIVSLLVALFTRG